jgi:hypothetical protein
MHGPFIKGRIQSIAKYTFSGIVQVSNNEYNIITRIHPDPYVVDKFDSMLH